MGNYKNVEIDFIERTLHLIGQYEGIMFNYKFEEQYNHTLLINCMLGLIVLPKEKTISFLPKATLGDGLRVEMGVVNSTFNNEIKDLRCLVIALRHSIAHFDIFFESANDVDFLIDRIIFRDRKKGSDYAVASFIPDELLSFLRYYASWLVNIIKEHQD